MGGKADPKALYQAHLDAVTDAFWTEDWDRLLSHMMVPGIMRADDAAACVYDTETLRASFIQQRESLRVTGALSYHRICLDAAYDPARANSICGTHETFALRGGNYAIPRYTSRMSLVCKDGRWLAAGITSKISNRVYSVVNPKVPRNVADSVTTGDEIDAKN